MSGKASLSVTLASVLQMLQMEMSRTPFLLWVLWTQIELVSTSYAMLLQIVKEFVASRFV